MKARQLELRGIPQFDSGRWKLRLERVPVDPDNETTMGMDVRFGRTSQAQRDQWGTLVPVTNRARQTRNDKHTVERIGRRQRLAKQAPTIRSRYPQRHCANQ